jgi:hypothetical protein
MSELKFFLLMGAFCFAKLFQMFKILPTQGS